VIRRSAAAAPTVAILPWGDVFEDWLDPLGITEEAFRDEFAGSWMFGYVEALRRAGIRAVIVCVTSRVERPIRWTHGPSEATMHLLPPTRLFRAARRRQLEEPLRGRRDVPSIARATVTHVAPYLATPPVQLTRVLRAERCTAILCQEYEAPRFDVCVALGTLLRLPTFATFQGGDYQLSRVERRLRPLTIRRAAGLIIPTARERERVQSTYGLPDRPIARIFNPIDLELWHPGSRDEGRAELGMASDAEVVIWHGQLHPRKGLDLLLAAWTRVCAERPGRALELVLVGAGEARAELDRQIARLGAPSVRLVGEWILDPARLGRLLRAGDIYAFPSRHEGFPVAPVEAMACGLPVVATDAQGVADIFEAGEAHGGIVVERDDVGGFATALGALLDDPDRRAELGRRARLRVEGDFSLEAVGRLLRRVLIDGEPAG
jgi:glycosyltransferase involved in cell wall biosynthesis